MGRWRPPAPKASPYITAAGYRALEDEVKELWVKRREIVKHLAAAAAEGDRSENAEYIYRKKQLRELDRRLGYLQRRMPKLKVVSDTPSRDRIYFGARVYLIDEMGVELCYRIVGSDEIDLAKEYISVDAPVARALLGKAVDDEVRVQLAERAVTYIVDRIEYP